MARHSDSAPVRIDAFLYQTTKQIAAQRGIWLKTHKKLKATHKLQCSKQHCNCGLELLPPLPKFPEG